MSDKIQELKEKQEELNEKLNTIQEANRRKDQDAAEIKELLTSCKDRLDHIKEMTFQPESPPGGRKKVQYEDEMKEWEKEKSLRKMLRDEKAEEIPNENKITCRIDLSQMKIRVKGPPEDLKNLNAAQLISMLDKSGCQELIINTDELQRKTNSLGSPLKSKVTWNDCCGEIPLMYVMHPGHLVMLAGIMLIATLVNTNLCNPRRGPKVKSLFNAVYLSTFAFRYGMILWMKIVRGFSLRGELSREMFNQVDNLILPKYYALSVFLSALSFYSLLATQCGDPCAQSWPPDTVIQVLISITIFFLELSTVSYVIPALVKLREVTDDFLSNDQAVSTPDTEGFERNMEKLSMLNWTLSLVNLLTTMLLGANMYFITTKLNFD